MKGDSLNEYGYLVDIVEVETAIDTLIDRYRDATLNDLPEFEELNPSVEHFSRILCMSIKDKINTDNINEMTVRLWENEKAWASYTT